MVKSVLKRLISLMDCLSLCKRGEYFCAEFSYQLLMVIILILLKN